MEQIPETKDAIGRAVHMAKAIGHEMLRALNGPHLLASHGDHFIDHLPQVPEQ